MVRLSRQQMLIYALLKNRMSEVHIDEITEKAELNIRGYTERITELRKKGFGIKNTRKGYYKLVSEPQPTVEFLKDVYVTAKRLGYPELMNRCVKKAQDLKFEIDVMKALYEL